jgi:Ni/Co efflux regulator RcnB
MRRLLAMTFLSAGVSASLAVMAADRPTKSGESWELASNASWVDSRLVRSEGWVPMTQGAKRYYCRKEAPRTGSRLNARVVCNDADTVELNYNNRSLH